MSLYTNKKCYNDRPISHPYRWVFRKFTCSNLSIVCQSTFFFPRNTVVSHYLYHSSGIARFLCCLFVCLLFSWVLFWRVMHPFQVYLLCAMFSILGEDYCQIFSVVDLHVGPCWLFSNNALAYIIVWLTTPMGKMKQILCSDWPCEPIFAAWDCLHWSHAKKKLCEAGLQRL